jgi:hypothetical protein
MIRVAAVAAAVVVAMVACVYGALASSTGLM